MKKSTSYITRAAIIAAIYCLLTVIFQPISFGAVQFRVSEALTLMPVLFPEAVPGLFVGCLLSNLLGGGVWYDVMLGSVA
ncbi:MAG: QueT transporter family protein, partial [Clostridia bacterium]|nr:QueT transporter family protein [Clostridia bacterium]